MSFARNFALGSQIAGNILDTYQTARRNRELAEIANAKETELPTQTRQATEDEVSAAQALADQGAREFGVPVEPALTPTSQVAQKMGVSFLGKTYDKPLSDDQRTTARTMAMADVIAKTNPIEGLRLRQSAEESERGRVRFDMEKDRYEREKVVRGQQDTLHGLQVGNLQRQAQREEDEQRYTQGRQALFNNSIFGQKNAQFAQDWQKYQGDLKAHQEAIASGMPPERAGLPPQAPSRPAYTVAESLADQGAMLMYDAQNGKVNTKDFADFSDRLRRVEEEGYKKALTLAQTGAPLDRVVTAFNSTGTLKINPKSVTERMVKGASGMPERVLEYTDEQGNKQTINVMSELKAIGAAGEVLQEYYRGKQDKRADSAEGRAAAAEGRAATEFNTAAPVREAASEEAKLRVELAKLDETTPEGKQRSNEIQAKILALKTGMRGVAGAHAPADVMKAKVLVSQGLYANEGEALDALSNKPDKLYQSFQEAALKTEFGNAQKATEAARTLMRENGWEKGERGTWRRVGAGASAAAAAKPANQADAHTQAKAAIAGGADKAKVNERLKSMGFDALP